MTGSDWLGLAAVVTGSGGATLAVLAVRHARREADTEISEALDRCRHDHETAARALHRWRLAYPDRDDPDPDPDLEGRE